MNEKRRDIVKAVLVGLMLPFPFNLWIGFQNGKWMAVLVTLAIAFIMVAFVWPKRENDENG